MFCLSFRLQPGSFLAAPITSSVIDSSCRAAGGQLVAVLGHVHNYRLFPTKQEVPQGRPQDDGQTEPRVVGHEDQHQQEAQRHLDDVQERLEQVHRRQHRGWLFVDHFADHVHNPRTVVHPFASSANDAVTAEATSGPRREPVVATVVVRHGCRRRRRRRSVAGILFGDRDGPVLEGVVRPPEQMLPVVLEALVQGGHDEDQQHRPEQTRQAVDLPLLEQDRFVVTAVERHRHHMVDHSLHSAVTVMSATVNRRRRGNIVHRVILQAVFHGSVATVPTVVVATSSTSDTTMVHVLAVVVMLRVVHIGFLLLMVRRVGQHAGLSSLWSRIGSRENNQRWHVIDGGPCLGSLTFRVTSFFSPLLSCCCLKFTDNGAPSLGEYGHTRFSLPVSGAGSTPQK